MFLLYLAHFSFLFLKSFTHTSLKRMSKTCSESVSVKIVFSSVIKSSTSLPRAEYRVNSLLQVGCDGVNSWVSHHSAVNTTLDASTSITAVWPEPDYLAALWARGKSCQLTVGGEKRNQEHCSTFWKAWGLNELWFTGREFYYKSRFLPFGNYENSALKIMTAYLLTE